MTVRVTTLKGAGAGRYYTERLPSYYLDGDEPPGRWWGRGAERLRLKGDIDADAFLAMMAGYDPTSGQNLGRRMGEGSVRGYDATFSAPKSVSVMFALGDPDLRRHAVEAHERAVEAVLCWVETHAHTRMRHRGHIVCVDSGGIVVGVFRQHTSRKLDPQLHTHAVIANRVRAPDGRWLALDARTIKVDQRTLSALYHVTLRSELTGRLGVRWETPEHGIAEIADMDPGILAEFSQRTTDLQRRLDDKLARFRVDLDRDPTPSERWRLEREAALDSRPAKPHGTSAAELRQDWKERVQALGRDPDRIVETVIGHQTGFKGIDAATAARLAELALDSLAERQSTWRPAELVRELAAAVPTTITADAAELTVFLQRLADHITTARCVDVSRPIPTGAVLRRDGRPISESAMDRALTTEGILDEEERLIAWAERRRDGHVPVRPVHDGQQLTRPQVEAASVVAGHGGLELIVGPAGSGKTTMLASAVTELRAQRRPVFGVAPTAAAADVLGVETGMKADTLDKLLTEHRHPARPPDTAYDLPKGTTVIVDEAGTAATAKLAELARLADQREWRVILVGDPRQFSAVGRGGMFAHLVETHGCVELDQIHRFHHDWERHASLQLRNGDPAALIEYDGRGRLHDGTPAQMDQEIITAWHQARSRGDTVALMANSTDSVTRLNRLAQHTRIDDGELDPSGPSLDVGDYSMLVGDEVVTRRNDRRLRTDREQMVKNRDHWTITAVHSDGDVTLDGRTGTIRLPAEYVTADLELGYAQTSHATQGRTVDVALLLVDAPTDSRGIYTPMTRGRDANHAYVVVEDNQTALDVLIQTIGRDWIDQPAVARRTQLDPQRDQQLPEPSDEDDYAKLEQRILHSIVQRRARAREAEHTTGRGL